MWLILIGLRYAAVTALRPIGLRFVTAYSWLTVDPSMPEQPQLSRRERQIMDAVFALGEATVNQVVEAISDPPTPMAVRRLMHILEDKGHLKRREKGREVIYTPRQTRAKAGRSALQNVLETFFGGSLEEALAAHLHARKDKVSDEERARLIALIEQAKSEAANMSLSSLLADSLTSTLNTAGLLIADSAIKGALLLTIASVVAWALRRDSAATRHWVWLVAVLSLLAIPTMSVVLPQWRVLPAWLTIEPRGNQGVIPSNNLPRPSLGQAKTMTAQPHEHEPWPVPDPTAPIASLPDESFDNQPLASPATLSQPMAVTASNQSWNWQATLAGCWSVGCIWLSLRLLFARALLGQASRGAVVIGKLHRQTVPACSEESLNYAEVSTAFKDACWQLESSNPSRC